MTDLRSACIEAMAEATVTRAIGRGAWPRPDDAATQMWRSDAANSLDALLGVLEDHADEWLVAEAVSRRAHESILTTKGIASLLAVLREDT